MTEIVNLRQARKRKSREDRERGAAANRARFGRTKTDREHVQKQADLEASKLAGHRLDDTSGDGT